MEGDATARFIPSCFLARKATMTRSPASSLNRLTRRRFAGLSAAAGAAALTGIHARPAVAQDPFTHIVTMTETETLGQVAGQPVEEVGPVEADGIVWTAMVQVPIKRGQWFHYTCEFDSAWSCMAAYDVDAGLDAQVDAVGIDNRVVPYWEETSSGIMVYGGDIGQHFCGELDSNLMSRSTAGAMRKAFDAHDIATEPIHDRAAIEASLNAGYPVFFKSTVDFLDWRPATWNSPEGYTYPVVFSNDHALTVIAYNDDEVVIRDPLGPTSTNANRPYQYRVKWDRFLQVFAAQGNDGLAVMPPETSRSEQVSGGDSTPAATRQEATSTPTPAPEPVDFATGDIAEVADDPQSLALNLREEASTDSEIIEELDPGTEVEITGELVEADGYEWYPVEVVYSGDTGFVVAEYLVPAED
jgi:hypothetical protein